MAEEGGRCHDAYLIFQHGFNDPSPPLLNLNFAYHCFLGEVSGMGGNRSAAPPFNNAHNDSSYDELLQENGFDDLMQENGQACDYLMQENGHEVVISRITVACDFIYIGNSGKLEF